jgi:hypothetical protein
MRKKLTQERWKGIIAQRKVMKKAERIHLVRKKINPR